MFLLNLFSTQVEYRFSFRILRFAVKSPSGAQGSVSQEIVLKKSQKKKLLCFNTSNSNNLSSKYKQFQVFKTTELEFNLTVHYSNDIKSPIVAQGSVSQEIVFKKSKKEKES